MTEVCSIEDLKAVVGSENVSENVSFAGLTTFRAGGPLKWLLSPRSIEETSEVIRLLNAGGIPWFVLGRGSNILASDKGFDGAAISFRKNMCRVSVEGDRLLAEAGAMNSEAAKAALIASLSGFEFASGIPGTVGGGLFMNAGAYGSEYKDIVISADILLPDGTVETLSKDELDFRYRGSAVQDRKAVALSAVFGLRQGDYDSIRALMDDLNSRRREKQPLEYGSAGSTFKRPEGYYAGKLIEDAGLKGYRYRDAGVSEKHAGFVINYGAAPASDIAAVIRHVQAGVLEASGVLLETEIRFLGDF